MTEELRIEYMSLEELAGRQWSENPKDHDLGILHMSIESYGYVDPLLINEETGELLRGHGRLKTCMQRKAAGDPPPDRVVVRDGSWYLPVVRGVRLSERDGHKYAIVDNRSSERGGWAEDRLTDVLTELAAEDEIESTGFDNDDLDQMLSFLKPRDYSEFEEEMEELDGLEEIRVCITIPKKHEDAVKAWLADGGPTTGIEMGRAVLRRAGLLEVVT